MKQGRNEEALEKLQEAIKLESDRASARCLMAQVLDNLGSDREVLEASWKICLECAKSDRRDEDVWIGTARRRLKELSPASPPDGNLD
jgi:predicted Zn-dependent protease